MTPQTKGLLTGRKVAVIAALSFGVILGVNILLAVTAVRTFSGMVVDNSYVASQHFNEMRDAQVALGWTVTLEERDNVMHLAFTDATGAVLRPATLQVTLGRPTTTRDDQTIDLRETPEGYAGAAPLNPGAWRIEINATAANGTAFHQSRQLYIKAAS